MSSANASDNEAILDNLTDILYVLKIIDIELWENIRLWTGVYVYEQYYVRMVIPIADEDDGVEGFIEFLMHIGLNTDLWCDDIEVVRDTDDMYQQLNIGVKR